MLECPTREALRTYGLEQARLNGVPESMYDRQIQQESGWQNCNADGSLKVSSGNAVGVCQIIQRWHPDVDATDPWASLSYSTKYMASLRQRFGSWRFALAAYNWGSANVGGYTKSDGTVVPPWDGRRETISDQGRYYLDQILGAAWDEPIVTPTSSIVYETQYADPQPAGTFATMPKGIILHGSRSGIAGNPKAKEYVSCANWEVNNPNDLGWSVTVGEGIVALHIPPTAWGWNARQCSDKYLAVEFAQATETEPITDVQVAAFVDWVKTRALPAWPKLPMYFPTHAELDGTPEYGPYHDGKSDVFAKNSPATEDLRRRIMAGLGATPAPPTPVLSVGPGILAAMQAHGDQAACDEIYVKSGGKDAYSHAYGRSGALYVYLPTTGAVHRYDPAA